MPLSQSPARPLYLAPAWCLTCARSGYLKKAAERFPGIREFIRQNHRSQRTPCPTWCCFCIPGGTIAQEEANTFFWKTMREMARPPARPPSLPAAAALRAVGPG